MLRVLINQATEGMRLSVPVVHPRTGNILLRAGFVLSGRVIEKLRDLEVHEFWIAFPGTEEIQRFVSPAIMAQQAKVTTMVAQAFEHVQCAGAASSVRLDFAQYRGVMRDLIEALVADPQAALYIAEMAGGAANLLRHSSEVSFLSIALGLKLQDYLVAQRPRLAANVAKNVTGLGLGGLVHDLGYLRLDESVIERNRSGGFLAGDAQWQSHVGVGHRLLSGFVPPSAAGVILQHHQHFDGSGFPSEVEVDEGAARPPERASKQQPRKRGLKGEEIHIFARIACVANYFDRLRRPAVYGANGRLQPRVRVLKQMLLSPLRERFDPVVLAALPAAAPAYQPGSLVRLSSGEHAVVVDWDPREPCRPTVQPVAVQSPSGDSSRATICPSASSLPTQPRCDLRECRGLSIVWHEGADVSGDNFDLPAREDDSAAGHSVRSAA